MFRRFLSKIFSLSKEKQHRFYKKTVTDINQYYETLQALSNDQLRAEVTNIRQKIADHLMIDHNDS